MIGKEIGHYKIIGKLGGGGMGIVYKAEDTRLKRIVALKFLPPMYASDQETIKRFVHEARSASALDHPNICTIYEIGETDDGQSFIAMACYDGQSLKELINSVRTKEGAQLSLDQVINIVSQIGQGLSRAHEENIIHRDIKPANIMQTERGDIKILDFGLAKLTGQTRLTKPGSTVGTIAYMSPEQARGDTVDQRSDIWSLGVVLYELLTGQLPFRGEYDQAVIYSILNEVPSPIIYFRTDLPDTLQSVVEKALAKEVGKRYQSVDEMIADLENLTTRARIPQPKATPYERLRRTLHDKSHLAVYGAVFVLIIAVIVIVLRPYFFEGVLPPGPTPVAVIGFKNQTGNPQYEYFREAIPNLLIASLEQTQDLRVTTWEKLNDLRRQLKRDNTDLVNEELGFELCQYADIDIVVTGSFIRAGEMFATDVRVLDATSKELLHSVRAQGEGIGSLLKSQIDKLSISIIERFGSPRQELQESVRPIEEITTKSMEAYNFFLRARSEYNLFNLDEARNLLHLAIAQDSIFAPAYLYLFLVNTYLGDRIERTWALKKANELAYRAAEKDRYYIEAFSAYYFDRDDEKFSRILTELIDKYPGELDAYYFLSRYSGDKEKRYEILNRAYQQDPSSVSPLHAKITNSLSYACAGRREFNRALELNDRYMQLSPGEWNAYHSRGEILFWKGDLDGALKSFNTMYDITGSLEWSGMDYFPIAYIYALRQEYDKAIDYFYKSANAATGEKVTPVRAAQKYFFLTIFQSLLGNYVQSEKDLNSARKFYEESKSQFLEFWMEFTQAWNYYIQGDYAQAVLNLRLIRNNLDPGEEKEYHRILAMFFAKYGLSDSASWYMQQATKQYVSSQMESDYDYRICYAEYLLTMDSVSKAIEIAEGVTRRMTPDVTPLLMGFNYNIPFYLDILPRAYARIGDLGRAISAYEELLDVRPEEGEYNITAPIYYFRLAKLYEQSGKKILAAKYYKQFLEYWKNADETLAEKKDAYDRLMALKI